MMHIKTGRITKEDERVWTHASFPQSGRLPPGWKWAKLSSIALINPPRRRDIPYAPNTPVTFVPMQSVSEDTGTIAWPEMRPLAGVSKGYTYFEEGDVLFAKITPCMQNGKHAIARDLTNGLGFGTTEFHVIRPGENVTADWIHRFLRQPWVLKEAARHFRGAVGQQRVPKQFLIDLPIPLPPLAEQKRIVSILNEQLAAVERARKAAVERLEAARALNAAYLRDAYESHATQSWEFRLLGAIADIRSGIQKTPARKPVKHFRPYLTVRNVQKGFITMDKVDYFEVTPSEVASYRLMDKDLLIVEGNGSPSEIGRNALFESDQQEWVHQNHIIRVRLRRDVCNASFVSKYLNSQSGTAQMMEKAQTTSGLYTLSSSKVASIQVPLPALDEQNLAVHLLDQQLAFVKQAEQAAEAELHEVLAMPPALLRRAFSGEI